MTLGRYVDDMFGADDIRVRIIGGECVDLVLTLLGIPLGPEKSAGLQRELIILGVLVAPDPLSGRVSVRIEPTKAEVRAQSLEECLREGRGC